MEKKVVEKPSVGIVYTETNSFVPCANSERVNLGWHFEVEEIWKKFNMKFEFQLGPVCRIVNISYREKEIFYSRYRVFFPAD